MADVQNKKRTYELNKAVIRKNPSIYKGPATQSRHTADFDGSPDNKDKLLPPVLHYNNNFQKIDYYNPKHN